MAVGPMTKRTRKLIILAALGLGILGLVPMPFGITSADIESAASHALYALEGNKRVLTYKGYARLLDTDYVNNTARVYFGNDLGISDTVFLKHGLKPIPQDRKLNVDKGDIVISFSSQGKEGKPTGNIGFSYVFGSLGAQGYEIRIYKSLLIRYFVFTHTWVS
jgi:hypothetical protein